LAVFAANSEANATIEVLVVGPPNSTVTVSEEIGASRTVVKSVALGPAAPGQQASFALLTENAAIPAQRVRIPALCGRRTRKFVAVSSGVPDARSEVLTPNCRKRFALAVPRTGATGAQVAATITDHFKLGDVQPTFCVTPPGAAQSCGPVAFSAGSSQATRNITLDRPGLWQVRLEGPPGESPSPSQTIDRTIAVGVTAPPAPGLLTNVAVYGDSIMSQVITPLEDKWPAHVKLDRNLVGGSGLTDAGAKWLQKAADRTNALKPKLSVVLLGGGDGGPIGDFACCDASWIFLYAYFYVKPMYDNLARHGGKVVWVLNPTPEQALKREVVVAVEQAVRAVLPPAAIVDLGDTLSPGGVYTPTVPVNGVPTRVRAEDGLHLSLAGADLGADKVVAAAGSLPQDPALNRVPVCNGFGGSITVGQSVVGGSCLDSDGDNVDLEIIQQPTKGTATVTGRFTSRPELTYTAAQQGSDSFKFRATDGQAGAPEITVSVNNVPVSTNAAPVCSGAPKTVTVGQSVNLGGCTDADGDPLQLAVTQPPTGGSVQVTGQGGGNPQVTYTATQPGPDTVKFKANDGKADSAVATVTTTNVPGVTNAAPVCTQTSLVATVGVPRDFTCTDADGDALSYAVEQVPARGVATGGAGVLRYRATGTGLDSFRFHATDGHASSAPVTVTTFNVAAPLLPPTPPPVQPPPTPKPKAPCAGLSGKRLAKCKLDRKVAKSCEKLKGKKRTVCAKRIRALEKCKKINQGTRQGVTRHRKCVRAAKAIGKPARKAKRRT
jgi:hypothetical protein